MSLDMNPEVRAQWCAALRSGDYEQGRQELYGLHGYCCLGVLCDLAEKEGLIVRRYAPDEEQWVFGGVADYLPTPVQNWAGLQQQNPHVRITGTGDPYNATLADLNDNGATFAEIANLIDGGGS